MTTPCDPKPLSLEERLALFDPTRHGGEAMNTENPLGAENVEHGQGLGRGTREMIRCSTPRPMAPSRLTKRFEDEILSLFAAVQDRFVRQVASRMMLVDDGELIVRQWLGNNPGGTY